MLQPHTRKRSCWLAWRNVERDAPQDPWTAAAARAGSCGARSLTAGATIGCIAAAAIGMYAFHARLPRLIPQPDVFKRHVAAVQPAAIAATADPACFRTQASSGGRQQRVPLRLQVTACCCSPASRTAARSIGALASAATGAVAAVFAAAPTNVTTTAAQLQVLKHSLSCHHLLLCSSGLSATGHRLSCAAGLREAWYTGRHRRLVNKHAGQAAAQASHPPVSADEVSRPLSSPVMGSTYDRLSPTRPAAILLRPLLLLLLLLLSPPAAPNGSAPSGAAAHGRDPACSATAAPATAAASAAAMSCRRSPSQLPAAALDTEARCCSATAASAADRKCGWAAKARMVGPPLRVSAAAGANGHPCQLSVLQHLLAQAQEPCQLVKPTLECTRQ